LHDLRFPHDSSLLIGIVPPNHSAFLSRHQNSFSARKIPQNRRRAKIIVGTNILRAILRGIFQAATRKPRISESAYFKLDEAGNYQYSAFGLPHLALRKCETKSLVISPYSTFLSLSTDPVGAIENLHRMADMGWFGSYGFYESADFTSGRRRLWQERYQLVRCWMVHHQGMSLLALANFLHDQYRAGVVPCRPPRPRQPNYCYTKNRLRMCAVETYPGEPPWRNPAVLRWY